MAMKATFNSPSMRYQRSLRSRVPEGNSLPNLGKHLGIHQIVPASLDRSSRPTANSARTDIGKAVLSSVGGNPRIVNQAQSFARGVSQISPHDSKALMRQGVGASLKHASHSKSLNSL